MTASTLNSTHVAHGTWIPGDSKTFDNHGTLILWVEIPIQGTSSNCDEIKCHPGHLEDYDSLIGFLSSDMLFSKALIERLQPRPARFYAFLPGSAGEPLPSTEMAQRLGQLLPDDAKPYEWRTWKIHGIAFAQPLLFLKEIQYVGATGRTAFYPGSDLIFWALYAQRLRSLVASHQFLPVMKCFQPAKKGEGPQIISGWSPASGHYEKALDEFACCMPGVCRAISMEQPTTLKAAKGSKPVATPFWLSARELLEHFSEQQLEDLVMQSRFPASQLKQFKGNWPGHALVPPDQSAATMFDEDSPVVEDWKKWRAWQQRILGRRDKGSDGRTKDKTGFILGLRLKQPGNGNSSWRIDFLVSSVHDPSLQVLLKEWWGISKRRKTEWLKYFGKGFEKNLLITMGHAARMCPLLWQGMETDCPTGLLMDLNTAHGFLRNDAPVLESAGFRVLLPSWWTPAGRKRTRLRINAATRPAKSNKSASDKPASGYFDLDSVVDYRYELSVGGQTVSPKEWEELVNAKSSLVQFRGEWIELDQEQMAQTLALWQEHENNKTSQGVSFGSMLKALSEANENTTEFAFDTALDEILTRLTGKREWLPLSNPAGLKGELRPYQQTGLSWLVAMEALGLNPCLADDMGLGKTVQVIALLLHERASGASCKQPHKKLPPTLLIAPTSVVGNWEREIGKFSPQLACLVHHGAGRINTDAKLRQACKNHDVLITSFTLARKDSALLKKQQWWRIVLDEAQNIKNPQSAQARAVCSLAATHRLALTGTPIENRLLDLWSLFHFLNPGYLGNRTQFRRAYEQPVQRDRNSVRSRQLQKLVQPFILRRMKTDPLIIDDLPEKVEQKLYCNLTKEQASLYQATVDEVEKHISKKNGMERRGLILSTLMRLKQICNHPAQFLQDGSAFDPNRSNKLARLSDMVEEALGEAASVLVFTQFTELGDRLERFLRETHRCPVYYLHGGTSQKNRQRMIENFQDSGTQPGVFVLSLKAGGTGITLTQANHVFHFDRWWNPAVENQATDRAYRIGQRNPVFVHKMVTLGTLEERIDALIEDKQALAQSITGNDENWLTEMDDGEFRELISLNRQTIMEAA
ncbi:MAG: DEAD/DEAH box helicase [Gammaproteobacteria bacterium]|nr:DEAD/DEAH box helicase [Gammaproteobacteria bacterium]